jgi:hypothetical protein
MRVIQMDPQEEWPGARLFQPCERGVDHFPAGPFRLELLGAGRIPAYRVIVRLETFVQTKTAVEHVGPHERGCGVAVAAEGRRQRRRLAVEHDAIFADTVDRGGHAGHDAGVRRQCQGRRRAHVGEPRAARRYGIEVRRQSAPQPVRSDGVERNEQDVGTRCRPRSHRCAEHPPLLTDDDAGKRQTRDDEGGDDDAFHRVIIPLTENRALRR